MLARMSAAAVYGIEAIPVSVEVDVTPGTPNRHDGRPARRDRARKPRPRQGGDPQLGVSVSVRARHRQPRDRRTCARSARRSICRLRLGVLAASGVLPHREHTRFTIVGGLSLDGRVPPMRGLLPIAVSARHTTSALVFPAANLQEAGHRRGPAALSCLIASRGGTGHHGAESATRAAGSSAATVEAVTPNEDLGDVRGQLVGRRALEIAAAGAHHLLFSGPPGAGKTMLARRLPGLLPPLVVRRGAHRHDDPFGRRPAAARRRSASHAAVSRAASHLFGRRAGRRRQHSSARRAEPGARRRALSGRAAGVQPPGARDAATAARTGRRAHRPRGALRHRSRRRHARRRDEPLSLRLRDGSHAHVPLLAAARSSAISGGCRARSATASISRWKCRRSHGARCADDLPAESTSEVRRAHRRARDWRNMRARAGSMHT